MREGEKWERKKWKRNVLYCVMQHLSCHHSSIEDPRSLHCRHPSDAIANHLAEHSPDVQR